jgi:hypothetical protein
MANVVGNVIVGALAERPAIDIGMLGVIYVSNDTNEVYRCTGYQWQLVSAASEEVIEAFLGTMSDLAAETRAIRKAFEFMTGKQFFEDGNPDTTTDADTALAELRAVRVALEDMSGQPFI